MQAKPSLVESIIFGITTSVLLLMLSGCPCALFAPLVGRAGFLAGVVLVVLAAAAVGVLSALGSWRMRVRRYRVSQRLCLQCGYDLRASEERCPECGMKIPRFNIDEQIRE